MGCFGKATQASELLQKQQKGKCVRYNDDKDDDDDDDDGDDDDERITITLMINATGTLNTPASPLQWWKVFVYGTAKCSEGSHSAACRGCLRPGPPSSFVRPQPSTPKQVTPFQTAV